MERGSMAISFTCACGKAMRAADEHAGKKTRCRQCGAILLIPEPEYAPDFDDGSGYAVQDHDVRAPARGPHVPPPVYDPTPVAPLASRTAARPEPPVTSAAVGVDLLLEYAYIALVFALIPLVVSLVGADGHANIKERIERSLRKATPAQKERVRSILSSHDGTLDELLSALPEGRLEGAFLPRDTMAHWVYAGIATAAFLLMISLFFSVERVNPLSLFLVGLFTGTIGIVFLLIFQLIGWTYASAGGSERPFILSAIGFTFGVGLWEEFTKAIPLFFYFKRHAQMGWRGACLWGLASGIGFGVSEGIIYSARSYNGVTGPDLYFVRFISCVALHAMWSASVGIAIARNVEEYDRIEGRWPFFRFMVRLIAVPMTLHGLYDALLEHDQGGWALFVALLSFAWLVMHIEMARMTSPHAGAGRRGGLAS
jgi:RsiW-degrading membrane proteinase PrsW (M82 family)